MYEFNLVIQSTFGPMTAKSVHAIRDNLLLFQTLALLSLTDDKEIENLLSVTIKTVFESEDVHDLYLQEVYWSGNAICTFPTYYRQLLNTR